VHLLNFSEEKQSYTEESFNECISTSPLLRKGTVQYITSTSTIGHSLTMDLGGYTVTKRTICPTIFEFS
jgi:hypothetical protein